MAAPKGIQEDVMEDRRKRMSKQEIEIWEWGRYKEGDGKDDLGEKRQMGETEQEKCRKGVVEWHWGGSDLVTKSQVLQPYNQLQNRDTVKMKKYQLPQDHWYI